MSGRSTKLAVAGLWVGVVAAFGWYLRVNDLGPVEAAQELGSQVDAAWWGPLLFVALYTVRPLVLFPASVLTVLAGAVFGPVWGTFWVVIAASTSTAATYAVGRYFGGADVGRRLGRRVGALLEQAERNPFEATLVMRLLYVPFDAVGYAGGFLRLRFVPFMIGSFLGTFLGIVAFVGFGASLEMVDGSVPSFDIRILLASIALAVAGSLLSRRLQRRHGLIANGTLDDARPDPDPARAPMPAPTTR